MTVNTAGLSLAVRKNIRDDFQQKVPELKKKVNQLTGHDYDFTADLAALYGESVKAAPDDRSFNNMGTITYSYFSALVSHIEQAIKRDDLVRDEFIKLTEKREFQLVHDVDLEDYVQVEVSDGVLYVKTRPSSFGTNSGYAGSNIIKVLKSDNEVLPVETKTNIRDGFTNQIPAVRKKLKEAVGAEYEFVVDFEDVFLQSCKANEDSKSWYTSDLGSVVMRYFESLVSYIHQYAHKDELVASEILKLTKSRKIHLVTDSDLENYNAIEFKDDAIWIRVRPNSFGTNSSIGYDLIDHVIDPNDVLSLKTKKNIRDEFTKNLPEMKKKLKKALGEDYNFQIDWEDVYQQVVKARSDDHSWLRSDFGGLAYRYFSSIVDYIDRDFKNDDLLRTELLNLTSERVFVIVLDADLEDYNTIEVTNGTLYIKVRPSSYGTNVYPGSDLIKKLHAPEAVLPVETKVDIRDNWDKKLPQIKKKLKTAVGEDYEFVVDWDDIYTRACKDQEDNRQWYTSRLGEIVHGYFSGLVDKIDSNARKDDLVRDGLLEVTDKRKIVFEFDGEIDDYNDIAVRDGCLHILVKPGSLGTNTSYIGHNLIDRL